MVATIGAVAGIASAASGIAGGIMGRGAANKAASQQAQGIQQGIGFEQGVLDQYGGMVQPWIDTGQNALSSLASFFGLGPQGAAGPTAAYKNFQSTPFYQFPLQQGIQARDQSAAARGLNLSGGQLKAVDAYGQGYASQNFSQYLTGLSQLAGGGLSAANQFGATGRGFASDISNAYRGVGTAVASGTAGAQNSNPLGQIGPLIKSLGSLFGGGGGSGYTDTGSFDV